jgi:FSR family fosmidomycin resistance protein-like MFS transporter
MAPFRNTKLWILTLGHFSIDFFASAGPLILAAQTAPLQLSQGQVGFVALLYSLTSSVTQPLFGWLSDRVRGPVLALGGILWTAAFTALAGLTRTLPLFALVTTLAGLGVGAFHPTGAAGVSLVSDARSRSGAMSVFLLGGAGAYAVGPLAAGAILERLGPGGTLWFGVLGLFAAPVLAVVLLRLRYDQPTATADPCQEISPSQAGSSLTVIGVALLMAVILFRSWASNCLTTYLPQYFTMQGFSLDYSGQVLFAYGLLAPLGSLAGGFLADRIGPRMVIAASLVLCAPLVLLQLRTGSLALMAVSLVLGFLSAVSLPLTIVLGQRLMPDRPGVISGLTMGFTFVMGGIGAALTGVFADHAGLGAALSWMSVLLAVGGALAMFLPGAGRPVQESVPAGCESK